MGHLINPIAYRLYNIRYWNNNWFLFNKNNYSYLIIQDILIYKFIKKFLSKYLRSTRAGILFVNLKILRSYKDLTLYLYIHDGLLDMLIFNLKKTRGIFKYIKRLRRKNYKMYKKLCFNLVSEKNKLRKKKKLKKDLVLKKFLRKRNKKFFKNFLLLFIKNHYLKIYWGSIKKIILWYLKKINKNYFNFKLFVVSLSKNNVNSNIICEYINIRLRQYYTIFEILRSMNYFLKFLLYKKNIIKGYKITCAGRFSRKQRATYSWKTFGSISLSTMKAKLDYCYTTIALKYSNCAIKVWIRLNKKKKNLVDFII